MAKLASLKPSKSAFVIAGFSFGFFMGMFEWLSSGIGSAFPFVSALIMGLFFGIGLAFLASMLSRRAIAKVDTHDEVPIVEGPANHILNIESRGGQLVLTSKHLWFFSHGLNVQNQPEKIEINRIKQVETTKALGIVPNAFSVVLDSGAVHKFIVSNRNEWIEELHKLRIAKAS